MSFNFCNNCGNQEFEVKTVNLKTQEITNNELAQKLMELFPVKSDIYYLKICKNCGKVEIFSAKILDKEKEKSKIK